MYLKSLRFAVKNLFALFSSLFKYFFSLFFLDLFYLGLGSVSNVDLKFTIFFSLLHYFVKFGAEIEASPVITAEVIKPVSTIPMIVFNRFCFLLFFFRLPPVGLNFIKKKYLSFS